ncbi:MAG: LysM peptidoglycan-binding domain-containing protein, partial [Planctomycetales bacterium]|nr:LysM peptidoglycan-binding domain-containing protein [Planctomycetales bacterium]
VPPMPDAPEASPYGQQAGDPYAGYAPVDGPEMAPLEAPQTSPPLGAPAPPSDPSASYQSLGDLPAQAGASFDQTLPAIYQALERDDLPRAHAMLSTWYREPSLTAEQSAKVNQLLSQLAGTVVYSTEHRLEPAYTVQPGETLEAVAARYNVPWRLLAKINGVQTADAVQPGQTLKVIRGPFAAVVDATNNELVLLLDGKYAGKFPVQLSGAAQQEGQWKVADKPQPQPPALPGMPPSEKQLVLKDELGAATIVIGGAGGSPLERGRVSVASRDLDELHDILSVGSQVVIKR